MSKPSSIVFKKNSGSGQAPRAHEGYNPLTEFSFYYKGQNPSIHFFALPVFDISAIITANSGRTPARAVNLLDSFTLSLYYNLVNVPGEERLHSKKTAAADNQTRLNRGFQLQEGLSFRIRKNAIFNSQTSYYLSGDFIIWT